MKRTMFKSMAFVIVCLLLFAGISFAQGLGLGSGGCIMAGGKWWHNSDYAKTLVLTSNEKASLDNLYSENVKSLIDIRASLQKDMLIVSQLLDAENLDEAVVLAKFKDHQNSRATMATEHFKYLLEIRKLLGATRFQQLRSLYNCNLGYGMGRGMGRGLGMGRGMGGGMGGGLYPNCPLNIQ